MTKRGNKEGLDDAAGLFPLAPQKQLYEGHRERLRARFMAEPNAIPDYELLELLLESYEVRRQAQRLVQRIFYFRPGEAADARIHDRLARSVTRAQTHKTTPAHCSWARCPASWRQHPDHTTDSWRSHGYSRVPCRVTKFLVPRSKIIVRSRIVSAIRLVVL